MENNDPKNVKDSKSEQSKADSSLLDNPDPTSVVNKNSNVTNVKEIDPLLNNKINSLSKSDLSTESDIGANDMKKKPVKPPKLEDKPFKEFINNYLIPGLKSSIEEKGTIVNDIKLIEGERPVVGGNCWMVFCKFSDERKFWLCFNKEIITSDKTILLAESNSDPSIVESFLIDERKTTLPLLISRVLQRLNGQKWIGVN